jgi:hypothetical protein
MVLLFKPDPDKDWQGWNETKKMLKLVTHDWHFFSLMRLVPNDRWILKTHCKILLLFKKKNLVFKAGNLDSYNGQEIIW